MIKQVLHFNAAKYKLLFLGKNQHVASQMRSTAGAHLKGHHRPHHYLLAYRAGSLNPKL
jgi:hypothetical protein